jgi:hypothetical protein
MHSQEIDLKTENEPKQIKQLLILTGEDFFGFESEMAKPSENDMVQLQLATNHPEDDFLNDVDNI